MSEKNPSIDPATAARIGTELDQAVAALNATEPKSPEVKELSVVDTQETAEEDPEEPTFFQDPRIALGQRDEDEPMGLPPQLEKKDEDSEIQNKRTRIDVINKAVKNGTASSFYGFSSDWEEKANAEVMRLEDEIRALEKGETTPVETPVEKNPEPWVDISEPEPPVRYEDIPDTIPQAPKVAQPAPEGPIDYSKQAQAARDRLRAAGYLDVDTAWKNKTIEGVSKLAETEKRLKETREFREQIANLERQLREMRERLEREEKTSENPVEVPPVPLTTPEVPPAERPIGMSGADAALLEFQKENEAELNRLKAKREGREAAAGRSIWEWAGEKGPRAVSWLKERAKGLATFGYWEVRQAEKVRKAGSDVSKEMEAGSGSIRQEVLSDEDRELIKRRLRESGNDVENMPDEQLQAAYEWLEEAIVREKKEANQVLEDRLVEESIKKIEDRLRGRMGTGGYRTFGGEATLENGHLTEDRRKDIETKLRGAIGALRKSQIDKDFINYGKLVRGSIDPKWYKRYVAGGIEAALGFALVNWVVVPATSSWAKAKFAAGAVKEGVKQVVSPSNVLDIPTDIGMPPDMASELVGITPGPEEAMLPLKDNLWNMGKELLQQQGVADPTNSQIMEVTKQLALDNQTSVAKWGVNASKWIDSMMPKGLPISIGGALRVASIAARAASGM